MTEHKLEEIHNYTKYKVVELLIKKHQEGNEEKLSGNNTLSIEFDHNDLMTYCAGLWGCFNTSPYATFLRCHEILNSYYKNQALFHYKHNKRTNKQL